MVELKALASLACLVVVAVSLSACQKLTLPKSDVDYCTVVADPPVKDGKIIAGPAHFTCDGKGPTSLTLTVTLQKQSSKGTWSSLRSGTFVTHGTATTRSLGISDRTRKVTASCSVGSFRTVLRAVEKSNGHTQVYDSDSVTVPKPCNETF